MKKIKIDNDLYETLEKAAGARGYATTEEYILHVLEQATQKEKKSLSEEEVKKRLKGLGYLG